MPRLLNAQTLQDLGFNWEDSMDGAVSIWTRDGWVVEQRTRAKDGGPDEFYFLPEGGNQVSGRYGQIPQLHAESMAAVEGSIVILKRQMR